MVTKVPSLVGLLILEKPLSQPLRTVSSDQISMNLYLVFKLLKEKFCPWARFSKAMETFPARKAIFSSSVFKDREVYTPETSCTEWNLCLY